MARCPVCSRGVPCFKLWTLTNFNTTQCSSCGTRLRAGRLVNSIVGGVGGATGALVLTWLTRTWFSWQPLLAVLAWLVALLLASSLLVRLVVLEEESK